MKLVTIVWYDAYSLDSWCKKEVSLIQSVEPMMCDTTGYLLSKNKDTIVICHTYNKDGQVCGVMSIPRKCISKINYL